MQNHNPGQSHRQRLLAAARLEILPFQGVAERAADVLPARSVVTVTCSPKHGLDRTIEGVELLSDRGHVAIPHLAASCVRDRRHLQEVVTRLSYAGVDDAFVIGGDGQTGAGAYPSALHLLRDLREMSACPSSLGVAGYPEGHPKIAHDDLLASLRAKAPLGSYVVTQMCFDPASVQRWVTDVRSGGVPLPLVLGLPGTVARRKLMEISARIGVATSTRFLTKNLHSVGKLLMHRTFDPSEFLAGVVADPGVAREVSGLHFFTFNQVGETSDWVAASRAVHEGGSPATA